MYPIRPNHLFQTNTAELLCLVVAKGLFVKFKLAEGEEEESNGEESNPEGEQSDSDSSQDQTRGGDSSFFQVDPARTRAVDPARTRAVDPARTRGADSEGS